MPLRLRLMFVVGLMLLVSLAGGSLEVAWRAAGRVRTELGAALDVGANTVRNGVRDLSISDGPSADLRRLIATFDGNRHIEAALLNEQDQPLATSKPLLPKHPVPGWFLSLIGGNGVAQRFSVPHAGGYGVAIVLRADPGNEAGEVWSEARDSLLMLGSFAALTALLICVAVGRALRPLENLSAAFARVASGDYHGDVPVEGPPELARLATDFNQMSERLALAAAQNRRLHERLLTLQSEERADLARDLHDEVGPLLFAVDMTAATIGRLADGGRSADIPTHVRSIHDAVTRMQRHVRTLVERLRPLRTIGLETAVNRLVAFWKSRRPEVLFIVEISDEIDQIEDDLKETMYRVVQEAVSNAIRHGEPTRVEIMIANDALRGIRVEITDDGIGMPEHRIAPRDHVQFGMIGMRERVMAMAGSLSIHRGRDGRGLALVVQLPGTGPLQFDEAFQPE